MRVVWRHHDNPFWKSENDGAFRVGGERSETTQPLIAKPPSEAKQPPVAEQTNRFAHGIGIDLC